ncbi:hypothetical protein [Rhodopseudomonas sp. P2A-2r]|uniref:hypothetical protein n=1 Tax=unclassified Rhodopseudomonas TaxID=2638247 RepID=UPI0022347ED3|nr:hypothetical protein [Rhodopseudomonas sp. P2A-2r]UZE46904.1 hypothetical protein ONR75_17895 [Rhodopseudomonas sp. P2A-2r]
MQPAVRNPALAQGIGDRTSPAATDDQCLPSLRVKAEACGGNEEANPVDVITTERPVGHAPDDIDGLESTGTVGELIETADIWRF